MVLLVIDVLEEDEDDEVEDEDVVNSLLGVDKYCKIDLATGTVVPGRVSRKE